MSAEALAQKYSLALFEAAEEQKKTGTISFELDQLTKVFCENETMAFFNSPFNSAEAKLTVAKSALEGKCAVELFNFMILLVENERVSFLKEINKAFQVLLQAKSGESEGTLFVASDVTEGFKSQIESALSKKLNKKIKLKIEKDPALVSGFKVSVGGWTIDDSAQFHLNKLKEDISKRGI